MNQESLVITLERSNFEVNEFMRADVVQISSLNEVIVRLEIIQNSFSYDNHHRTAPSHLSWSLTQRQLVIVNYPDE